MKNEEVKVSNWKKKYKRIITWNTDGKVKFGPDFIIEWGTWFDIYLKWIKWRNL